MESKNKPTVLVFIDWFAPGYKSGGPVRSMVNMIDHLKSEVYFMVVTRNADYLSNKPYPRITPNRWTKHSENCEVCYLAGHTLSKKQIADIVKETPYSTLYINGIYSLYFSILPLYYSRQISRPAVVAPRGMLAETAIAIKGVKKKGFLKLARTLGLFKNTLFHATSTGEVNDIIRVFPKAQIARASNLPEAAKGKTALPGKPKKQSSRVKLVYIARLAPEKNMHFLLNILQQVSCPRLNLDIYGPVYDWEYWEKCKKLMKCLPPTVQCDYHGPLERDKIDAVLAPAHFLVLPTLGENYGHAIVEAWGTGTPVLISDTTPWTGLESQKLGFDLPLDKAQWGQKLDRICAMTGEEYKQYLPNCFHKYTQLLNDEETVRANLSLFVSEQPAS